MESMQQKKILVIETSEALQMLYEAELREEGFNTFLASSITEAQQLLFEYAVDLIIADLRDRRATGMDRLIALARERDIPLVINTSYPLNMIDQAAIRDAAWIQEKTSDIDRLKDKIGELVGKAEPRLQLSQGNAKQRVIEGSPNNVYRTQSAVPDTWHAAKSNTRINRSLVP